MRIRRAHITPVSRHAKPVPNLCSSPARMQLSLDLYHSSSIFEHMRDGKQQGGYWEVCVERC